MSAKLNLEKYFNENDGSLSFTRENASAFAKLVAGDFNPIHNPDARRFCVPGDLLFAVFLHRHGVASSMNFDFQNMVDDSTLLRERDEDGVIILGEDQKRDYLVVKASKTIDASNEAIKGLIKAYVQFSGQTFPYLLVDLMKDHQVMINPARPLVLYKSMEIQLDGLPDKQITLEFSGARLDAEGKKGEVSLNFDIFSSGQKVGKGNKKMLLGGLMPYDQLKIDGLVDEYNKVKTEYLAAQPN